VCANKLKKHQSSSPFQCSPSLYTNGAVISQVDSWSLLHVDLLATKDPDLAVITDQVNLLYPLINLLYYLTKLHYLPYLCGNIQLPWYYNVCLCDIVRQIKLCYSWCVPLIRLRVCTGRSVTETNTSGYFALDGFFHAINNGISKCAECLVNKLYY